MVYVCMHGGGGGEMCFCVCFMKTGTVQYDHYIESHCVCVVVKGGGDCVCVCVGGVLTVRSMCA